jgi:hypothetical protein
VSVDSPGLDFGVSKRIDCGIAMLHLEMGLLAQGIHGAWEFLEPPQVAKFVIYKREPQGVLQYASTNR